MRAHPIEAYRGLGTLTLRVDPGNGVAHVENVRRPLPRHGRGETRLAPLAWIELPTLSMLCDRGDTWVRKWAHGLSADDRWAHPALRAYDSFRRASVPARAYAQLGGWEQSWPDDYSDEYESRTLLIRTIRHAEPFVEVFEHAGTLEARTRVT
jgi:hypothetical protein